MPDERPDAKDDGSGDDAIVREAKKRFRRCEEWEATARKRSLEDTKFENGDSDNLYQWPDATLTARGYGAAGTGDQRPCLTVNKTHQHCLQIINDARQNRTHIKFRPVGNGATSDAAQVFDGIVRYIEYISNAQQAYATATRHQVVGGIGYLRVTTAYVSDDSFDQDILIKRVNDPMSIYIDPDHKEADGSDARFGFVFEDEPRDLFEEKHPNLKDHLDAALGNEDGWVSKDTVRTAEYFRREEVKDKLVAFKDPKDPDSLITLKRSEMNRGQWRALMSEILADPDTQQRDVISHKIHWYKIAGDQIIADRPWPGKYIPIARVPGEETVIDGQMDRKGHVRALKDPQRMYNYNASAQVEFGALQNKIPYIAPAEAIEGYETYWESANNANYSVLPYNAYTDKDAKQIPAPQRQAPPNASQAYELAMKNAANDMMLVSGQYQADFGAPSNERSGVAIQQRQRQGATATYHFIDHLAMAVRFIGKIILDLIPHIYDTKRIIKIMAEDGSDSEVLLDPSAAEAFFEKQVANDNTAKQIIFNPNVGRYDVISDVGPDFATRRQEAYNALTQFSANPELMQVIGDLMFKSADFEYADEIAERLERLVPPQAKGDGPNPQVVQLQQQVQAMSKLLDTLGVQLQKKELELKDKSAKTAEGAERTIIDAYRAETDRLTVFKDFMAADPDAAMALVRQVMADALNTDVTSGVAA